MGYRHIDCAYGYGNESEVGKALEYGLKELKIPRKVLNTQYATDSVVSQRCKQQHVVVCPPLMARTIFPVKLGIK